MGRIVLAFCLLALSLSAGAARFSDKFEPGMSYYFENFEPAQRPWKPGPHLNVEEVFKNYQYYEIEFDQDGKGFTANQFIKGSKANSEKYLILPDGALQKIER